MTSLDTLIEYARQHPDRLPQEELIRAAYQAGKVDGIAECLRVAYPVVEPVRPAEVDPRD